MKKYSAPRLMEWHKAVLTVLFTSTLAFLLMPLAERWELANIVMLFLLVVLVVAIKLGKTSGVIAAICSVFLFDFLFVPPRSGQPRALDHFCGDADHGGGVSANGRTFEKKRRRRPSA